MKNPDNTTGPKLALGKLVASQYQQEMHCCGDADTDATLSIAIHDGGGGPYLTLTAHEFSLDGEDDIQALADLLREHLPVKTP